VKNPVDINLPWFVWNERRTQFEAEEIKIVPAIQQEDAKENLSDWSVQDLIAHLKTIGLAEKARECVEKQELIDLILQHKNASESFRIASRARVDSVYMVPPSLSPRCKVYGNKIENFQESTESKVPDWISQFGHRERYYGVFKNDDFQYGVIWNRETSEWERIYLQQVKRPLNEEP